MTEITHGVFEHRRLDRPARSPDAFRPPNLTQRLASGLVRTHARLDDSSRPPIPDGSGFLRRARFRAHSSRIFIGFTSSSSLSHQLDASDLSRSSREHEVDRRGTWSPWPARASSVKCSSAPRASARSSARGDCSRDFPFGLNQALAFEPVQRWIERALPQLQDALRHHSRYVRMRYLVHGLELSRAFSTSMSSVPCGGLSFSGHRAASSLLSN